MEENLPELNSSSPRFSRKTILSVVVLIILLISLPIGVYLVQHTQIFKPKAAEKKGNYLVNKERPKPEYAPGEIIFKLKPKTPRLEVKQEKVAAGLSLDKQAVSFDDLDENTIPSILKQIHQKYKIKQIEKVFKGTEEPEKELNKFKNRFAKEIQEGRRKINEKEFLKIDLSKTYKITFENSSIIKQTVQELSQSSDVEYAELNYFYNITSDPNDPYFLDQYPDKVSDRDPKWNPPHDYQWNIKKTNSSNNWQVDTSGIIVAVIDTGVDVVHPELGNVWINEGEIPSDGIDNDLNGCTDDINGCRFIYWSAGGGDIMDDNGHGTHVAGIISSKTNNALGIAGVTGNSKIMAVKALDQDGTGLSDGISQGIIYAVNNGARVLNMSLGGSWSSVFEDALDLATVSNVITAVAAGNGNRYSSSEFPASYKPAITVSGVDEELNKMKYSNYGPNVDVSAPGGGKPCMYITKPSYCSNILSLKSSQGIFEPELNVGDQYLRLSGTSMATPHVAGIIALLLAQHPEFTLQDIENYIRFNSIDPQGIGHNEKTGWGVISSTGTSFIPSSNIDFMIRYPAENSIVGNRFNIAGTIKADNFSHFDIKYRLQGAVQWITTGVELVNNGQSPVASATSNPAKIGTISLPEDSLLGTYEISITLFMTNGKSLTTRKNVHYLRKPNTTWLYTSGDTESPGTGEILIADLDNNGKKEIILYNYYSSYYDRKSLMIYDDKYSLKWKIDLAGEAVVGDLDKRNFEKEVIVQTKDKIYIYNVNGQIVNDMTLSFQSRETSNLMVLDADKNGIDELYFYDSTGSKIHSYEQDQNFQFKEKWNYVSIPPKANHLWPIGGDVDGDGYKEIVVINNDKIEVLNYQGKLVAAGNYTSSTYELDSVILADVDLDGKEEIALHIQWGETKLFKLNGSSLQEMWSYNNSDNIETLAAGDFDGNKYPEIYVQVHNTGEESIIDYSGNVIFKGESGVYWSNANNGGVMVTDRNNNGLVETQKIGLYSVDNRVYSEVREFDQSTKEMLYIDGDWKTILPQWGGLDAHFIAFGLNNFPSAIVDLDNNGKLDLVIGGIGIIEYDSQGVVYWSHRYHDYQRTGSYNFKPKEVPIPTPSPTLTPTPTPSPSLVPTPTPVPGSKVCLQVITSAKNPLTGECKTYPTSCIPEGWVKVSSCTIQ